MRRSIALLVVAVAVAGCAPSSGVAPDGAATASQSGPRQCFDPARIVNFARGEPGSLYVRALNGDVFEVGGSACPDIGAGLSISITPAVGIGSQVCVGEDVQVVSPGSGFGPARCRARLLGVLSDAQVEALPSRYRP